MINTNYKTKIIRYVLDASPEENENLAVFIACMQAEKQAYLQAKREKGIPGSGEIPRWEEQGTSGRVSGVV